MATTSKRSLVSRAGAAARKVVGKKATPAKKAAAAKTAAPAKRTATQKAAAKKAPAKKAPAKKAAAKKTTPAKKAVAKKTTVAKNPAAPAKKAPAVKAPAKKAPAKAPAAKPPAKKAPAKKAAMKKVAPSKLVVLDDEGPWTRTELAGVTGALEDDIVRLTEELGTAEVELADMLTGGSDGAGNDQADVGSATFERDQEMTIANNAREMLTQSERALRRIADGTYGVCENCGNPIGKNRLMAFPRASLCLSCKQREERR